MMIFVAKNITIEKKLWFFLDFGYFLGYVNLFPVWHDSYTANKNNSFCKSSNQHKSVL